MNFSFAAILAIVAPLAVGCAQRPADAPENPSLSTSAPAWAAEAAVGEPEMTFEAARPNAAKRGPSVQQSLRASRSAQPTR